MKAIFSTCIIILTASLSFSTDDSLESVIAKHIQAKGGAENWAKVKSLKITGNYTGFSITDSFTLYKMRPHQILFDHTLNNRKMLIGFDGKDAWWFNGWNELPMTTKVEGEDYKVLIQDAEFATPFFDFKTRGISIVFKGEGDIDGTPSLVLEVTRNADHVETWHLDPSTYLELARVSPGSEFGRPVTQTTIFDDFRDVAGIKMPYYTETEFHTRHRVMEIDRVEVNPDISAEVFHWAAHEIIAPLQIMPGTWNVTVEERSQPQQPWQKSATTSVIEKALRGNLFLERITFGPEGNQSEHLRQWGFDPFKKVFRVTQVNDFTTHLNVFEGVMEEGILKVDNLKTQTPWEAYGRTFHEGLQWHAEGNGFVVEMVRSMDGGTNWFVNKRFTYTKP